MKKLATLQFDVKTDEGSNLEGLWETVAELVAGEVEEMRGGRITDQRKVDR